MSYEIKFKKVNDISNADICVYNAKNEKSIKTVKVVETLDPNQTHPLKQSDIIKKVQNEIDIKGLTFVPYTISKNTKFTADTFGMFCKYYKIKSNSEYDYFFEVAKRYSYSYSLIEFIIQKISDDPEIFVKIKNEHKKVNFRCMGILDNGLLLSSNPALFLRKLTYKTSLCYKKEKINKK